MKVLIDENLPESLYNDFLIHKAITVKYAGWKGKENGELIKLMIANDISVLVTLDKNLQYQQNLEQYPIIIIVIKSPQPTYTSLRFLVKKIEKLLGTNPVNGVYSIT